MTATNFHKFLLVSISFLAALFVGSTANAQNPFPLDIVWSTETYVPPGFDVKALPPAGSVVNFVALTPTQNPAGLDFTWVVEDSSYLGQGPAKRGGGENTFTFFTQPLVPGFTHKIKVVARSLSSGAEATARVEVKLVSPEVQLYFGDGGPYAGRVGGSFNGRPGESGTLSARPFYFSVGSIDDLLFSWVFDGRSVAAESEPSRLDLSVTPDTLVGTERTLSLTVTNSRNARERARVQSTLKILSP